MRDFVCAVYALALTMHCSGRFVHFFLIFCYFSTKLNGAVDDEDVHLAVDDELDEIINKHDYVLILFQPHPCTSDDCKAALQHTSYIARSSYIAGLKVVRVVNSALQSKLSLGNKSRLIFYRNSIPILFDSQEIRLDDVVIWLEQNKERNSRQLDNANFEHLTQAATGATTGDWFVLFQSSQCDHLLPLWETVGSHLRYRINLATVDIEENPKLKSRFRVTKCPTIIFFRLGRMYMYELSTKELTPFLQFADGWYVNAPSFHVPGEPTPFDALTDKVVAWLKSLDFHEFSRQSSVFVAVSVLLALVVGCFCCRKRSQEKAEPSKID